MLRVYRLRGGECDGVQGRPLRSVSLWHVACFELKTIGAQRAQEPFTSPFTASKS